MSVATSPNDEVGEPARPVPQGPEGTAGDLAVSGAGRGAGESTRPGRHWPALDGLRAIAVLAVIGIHVGVFGGGYLGVDVFFVLSGFLITSLLIGEWDSRGGSLRLRDFYARRVLRLFPALGCVVLIAGALGVLVYAVNGAGDRVFARATFGAIPWVASFASNFAYVLHPGAPDGTLGALSHTWSLAVEEQFYILWPGIFLLLIRRGCSRSRLALALAVVAVAEMAYRILMANAGYGHDRLYYAPDTHSDGLLLGCAVAFWLASGPSARWRQVVRRFARPAMWLAVASLCLEFVLGSRPGESVQIAVAALASAVLVAGVVLAGTPALLERVLCARLAIWTGKRSYGLYLWHVVFIATSEALCAPRTGLFPASPGKRLIFATALGAAVAASFIVADLSYRFIELPALRLKHRFQLAGPDRPPEQVVSPATRT